MYNNKHIYVVHEVINMSKQSVHVGLNKELYDNLNSVSLRTGLSKNSIIEEALADYLEEQQDIQLAYDVLKEIENGDTKVLAWSDAKKQLDIK